MLSAKKLVLIVAIVALFAVNVFEATPTSVLESVCSLEEKEADACYCCKRTCWIRITEMMTAFLGHMPGEHNDGEAQLTLAMMRRCFLLECTPHCN